MEKALEEMSSEELRGALSDVTQTLSESGEVETRVDIRQITQEPDDELSFSHDPDVVKYEEAQDLPEPEQEDAQQKAAQFGVAVNLDLIDLAERYGDNLVQKFNSDLQRNRVQIPKGIEKVENTLEYLFREVWLPGQKVSASELDKFLPHRDEFGNIEDPERTIPLRSRSMDVLIPARVRPTPKPKPKAEKTYRVPNLSTEDMQEMLVDWSKKHPERF